MNEKLKNSIKLALKDTFNKWLKEKQQTTKEYKNLDLEENQKELLQYENYDIDLIDNCIKEIINQGFPPSALSLVIKRINHFYSDWIPKQAPSICIINFDCKNYINALEWTLVNIHELNFFDMSDIDFKLPYNQCHYCGKPNSFMHQTGVKSFNRKRKYCHDSKCAKIHDANGSNPKEHENCCFGKFAIEKKKLYEQIRRIKTENDIEAKMELFIAYCEKRFKENLKIKWSIQTEHQKAIFEDDWFLEESWNSNIKEIIS